MRNLLLPVPCFAVAGWILWKASDPEANLRGLVESLLILEFLSLHSGVFLAGMARGTESVLRRVASFVAIFFLYGLFAYLFAITSTTPDVLYAYVFLMLGRFMTLVWDVRDKDLNAQYLRSAGGIVLLLVAVGLGAIFASIGPQRPGSIGGVAILVIYFVCMGLFELVVDKAATKVKWGSGIGLANRR